MHDYPLIKKAVRQLTDRLFLSELSEFAEFSELENFGSELLELLNYEMRWELNINSINSHESIRSKILINSVNSKILKILIHV